jgi:lipoprotein-anchoring transpeptidase ErfK/SrfK
MEGTRGIGEHKKGLNRLILALVIFLACTAYGQTVAEAVSGRARRQIIVSVPDRKLAVLEDGVVLRTFAVSVGAAVSPSPNGEFEIVNRLTEPTYYHAGTVIPAGPDNPLGPRWVGLNKHGYGIHGTNAPGSIGKAASHGCIRLRNHDIVQLFALVSVGDTVQIRGERDEQTAQIFGNTTTTTTVAVAQEQTASVVGGGQ